MSSVKVLPWALLCALGVNSAIAETWSSLDQAKQSAGSSSSSPQSSASAPQQSSSSNHANQLLFSELEQLKQELQRLQGIVDKQGYELRQLKTEQKERYLDLDRRLSQALSKAGTQSSNSASSVSGDDQQAYDDAFALMKDNKLKEGREAFAAFLKAHPKSPLAVNGYYWLGQIDYNLGSLDEARKAFSIVVNQYPDHQKSLDSRYKLAVILHKLGKTSDAKPMLEAIVKEHKGSSTARFASQYLKQHF